MPNWDISQVTNLGNDKYPLFGSNCQETFNGDISKWDVSQVTNMYQLFYEAKAFNQDIGGWDVSRVTSMDYMFYAAHVFDQEIALWDVSQVTTMQYMFQSARKFTGNIARWNDTKAENQYYIFYDATAFQEKFTCDDQTHGPVRSCECKSKLYCLTDEVFHDAVRECLVEDPVAGLCEKYGSKTMRFGVMPRWNTRLVTNMDGEDENTSTLIGFAGKAEFIGDLSNWDTSSVTSMRKMFYKASAFNGELSRWNTSQVTTTQHMFEYASRFNGAINSWDVKNIKTMGAMFSRAYSFNQDLSAWDTSNVLDMSFLFRDAISFDRGAIISEWTGNAVVFAQTGMFSGATAFQARFSCTDADDGPLSSCSAAPTVCANARYVCSHVSGVFNCARWDGGDLTSIETIELSGFDSIPTGEFVKQCKFMNGYSRMCVLFTGGSIRCVEFSDSFQITATYDISNGDVVSEISSGSSHSSANFIIAVLKSGTLEMLKGAIDVVPVSGLPTTSPIVKVAFQLPAFFYAVTADGKVYHCSLDTSTGECGSVTEISPTNSDTFNKQYPDLLGQAIDVFADTHESTSVTFGGALLNDGTIRAWGRDDFGCDGDGNGNICAIGYTDCTANPIQNVLFATGSQDSMWLLLGPEGTITKYGRYATWPGFHPKELHQDVSGNILTGITEITGAKHGACAINGNGELYCALVATATFNLIPRTPTAPSPTQSPNTN